jgi:pimeloyl-ACP methyl ester carboxylesterase
MTPTVPALADSVMELLEQLEVSRPHVAGNSMGGWLALELGRRGRATSVIAVSPAGMWSPKENAYARRTLRFQHAAATRLAPHADTVTRTALGRTLVMGGVCSRPWRADPSDAAEALRLFAGAPGWQTTLEAMHADRPRDVGSIECPVRIVWGTRDTLLLPRQADRLLREIPRAELVKLPGLGHVPMADDPEAVAESILQFTARHAREKSPA